MPGPVHELRVALTVDDYEEAVRFYRDALGLPVEAVWENEGGSGVVFDAGRATLEVLSTKKAEFVDRIEVGGPTGATVRLALRVDDSETASERLVGGGAELLGGPVTTPWDDRNVRLRAPDGMQLTLFSS
jgi:lactoylglutathione lyase